MAVALTPAGALPFLVPPLVAQEGRALDIGEGTHVLYQSEKRTLSISRKAEVACPPEPCVYDVSLNGLFLFSTRASGTVTVAQRHDPRFIRVTFASGARNADIRGWTIVTMSDATPIQLCRDVDESHRGEIPHRRDHSKFEYATFGREDRALGCLFASTILHWK